MTNKKISYGVICLLFSFIFLQPTLAATKKVAMIGSSSFAGFCGVHKYHNALTNTIPGYQFDCFALSATDATWFLEQFNKKVKGKGYSEIIIYSGLNSLYLDEKLKSGQSELTSIFEGAKKENMRVIAVSAQPFKGYKKLDEQGKVIAQWTPKWGDNIIKNNAWVKENPSVNKFIDTYKHYNDGTGKQKQEYYAGSDYLHVNAHGYKLMFQLIAQEAYDQPQGLDPNPSPPAVSGAGSGSQAVSNPNPATDASLMDDLYRSYSEKKLTDSELQKFLQQPVPKIKIPGLSFSNISLDNLSADTDGGLYISFPYLGEYILAVYKYAVVIAGIISVILLIIAGIEWTMTGENIERAKKRIGHALTGLVLTIGSYSILYLVNPELVNLRSLRVRLVAGVSVSESISSKDFTALTGLDVPSSNEIVSKALEFGQSAGIIDQCLILAILKDESEGNPLAIGHDENYTGNDSASSRKKFLMSGIKKFNNETFDPPVASAIFYIPAINNKTKIKNNDDKFVNAPMDYGLDWRFSHGFGAGQITFDGYSRCNGQRGTIVDDKCYTIPDLLNPMNNLSLMIRHIKIDYDYAAKNKGLTGKNLIIGALAGYQLGNAGLSKKLEKSSIDDGSFVPKKVAKYDKCIADPTAFAEGIAGK